MNEFRPGPGGTRVTMDADTRIIPTIAEWDHRKADKWWLVDVLAGR